MEQELDILHDMVASLWKCNVFGPGSNGYGEGLRTYDEARKKLKTLKDNS